MPDTPSAHLSPREVLAAYHQAIVEADPDAVAELYAVDAVHEFPFLFPGVTDYHGREEVRAGYRMPTKYAGEMRFGDLRIVYKDRRWVVESISNETIGCG